MLRDFFIKLTPKNIKERNSKTPIHYTTLFKKNLENELNATGFLSDVYIKVHEAKIPSRKPLYIKKENLENELNATGFLSDVY